jgi:TolB-like protein
VNPRPIAELLRVAVLPFAALSADPADAYFSDGLTDETIAQIGLLRPRRVAVVARLSSMMFKGSLRSTREVGELLLAPYVVEGSTRREGNRVRIIVRLVDAAAETHIWSEVYERVFRGPERSAPQATDALSIQAEVGESIARALAEALGNETGFNFRRATLEN